MNKHLFILAAIFLVCTHVVVAQNNVGINTNTPHASSALDITSTDKGILIPRMTLAQRNAITAPAVGLMIYQSDNIPGFYYYNNLGNWIRISNTNDTFSLPFHDTTSVSDPLKIVNSAGPNSSAAITGKTVNTLYGNGIVGESDDLNGVGVFAYNSGNGSALKASSNTPYPLYGTIFTQNYGGGNALFASSDATNTNASIYAQNIVGGFAIKGSTASNTNGNSAIEGTNSGTAGFGIKGISNASNTAGIRGESVNGVGVNGFSSGSVAVAGSSISGTALKGTSQSGYGLESVGDLRLAGGNTNPSAGAILTSTDAMGNAVWKKSNVGFCVRNALNTAIPSSSASKVEFNVENYDLQNNFTPYTGSTTPSSSKFTAPVAGVYNFTAYALLFMLSSTNNFESGSIRLLVNGVILFESMGTVNNTISSSKCPLNLNANVHLNAGDQVWIAVYQSNEESDPAGFLTGFPELGSFSGNLLFAD